MARSKAAKKPNKDELGGGSRSARRTKDGRYVAVNVYVHVDLLDRLDGEAADEDRTRRAQLERVLCRAFGVEARELRPDNGAKR